MDESEISIYTEPAGRDYMNQEDRFGNSYDKGSEEHNINKQYEDKGKERIDFDHNNDADRWNEDEHKSSFGTHNSKEDLDIITPDTDTVDSAIGSGKYFIGSLGGSDKPVENGITPLLGDDVHTNSSPEQIPPQEAGCAVDCMYYTLMCCECSIL